MLKDIADIAKDFVNREKELKELGKTRASLKKYKPRHLAITGARRLGKTYLLYKYIQESISGTVIPIYIDVLYRRNWSDLCDEIIKSMIENYVYYSGKKIRVERFSKWLTGRLQEIVDRLNKIEAEIGSSTGAYVKLRASIKERPEDEIELVKTAMRSLEEFADKKNICFIIIFDGFQHIEKFSGMPEVIAAMRSVVQFQKRVQYIFSGSSTTFTNKIFVKATSAFWRQIEIFKISHFDAKATIQLVKSRNIDISKDGIDVLNSLTKGIPDYIVKTLNELTDIKKPNKSDIQQSFKEIIKKESLLFSDLFERLPSLQQQVLILLAEGKTHYKELEEEIGEKVGGVLNQMINAQLIERIQRGQYNIFDPVFRESIKNRIFLA